MMATRGSVRKGSEEEAALPGAMPPSIANHGGIDAAFVWQQLSEIQKSLGGLEVTSNRIQSDIDKLESKVDKIDNKLSGVTHKIYAATAVLAVLVGIGSFIVNKAWDMMAKSIQEQPIATQQISTPPGSSPPPRTAR